MAKITGKNLYLEFGGVQIAGTGIEEYQEFEYDEATDMVESTAGDADNKTYIPTQTDRKFSLTLTFNAATAATALRAKLKGATGGSLIWGEDGTASGKPKGSIYAYLSNIKRTMGYNALVTVQVNFQGSGAPGDDPATATW